MQKLRMFAAQVLMSSSGLTFPMRVVHDVAGVVVHLHVLVVHFADDFAGHFSRLAVLLHHEQHAVVAGDRAQLLEPLHPELAVGPFGMAERQHVRNSSGLCLQDAVLRTSIAFGCSG